MRKGFPARVAADQTTIAQQYGAQAAPTAVTVTTTTVTFSLPPPQQSDQYREPLGSRAQPLVGDPRQEEMRRLAAAGPFQASPGYQGNSGVGQSHQVTHYTSYRAGDRS